MKTCKLVFLLCAGCVSAYTLHAQTGIVTGIVTDQFYRPLQNVHISIAGLSTSTDASGSYTLFGVPVGALVGNFNASPVQGMPPLQVQFVDQSVEGTQRLIAAADGFETYTNDRVLVARSATTTLSFRMIRPLGPDQVRFVLRWGARPPDLDAHLKTPYAVSDSSEVYFRRKGSSTAPPFATLDVDETQGYGPETITISRFLGGTYHFYAYIFTPNDTSYAGSRASVEIYTSAGLLQTVFAPASGTGRVWKVCDVNGDTRGITVINQITADSGQVPHRPDLGPEKILQPAQTRSTVLDSISGWHWDFGDGGTSTLQDPSHVYTVPGIYPVSLSVTSGTTTVTETKSAFVSVGAVRAEVSGDTVAGRDQIVSVVAPFNITLRSARLFYRQGGAVSFDSMALTTSTLPFTASIPASAVTMRGVEYYVAIDGTIATGAPVRITQPPVTPGLNPLEMRVKSSVLASTVVLQPLKFHMVSVPAELSDPSVRSVFVDDFGEYDSLHWRLFRWKNGMYVEYPGLTDSLFAGRSFWLASTHAQGFNVSLARSTTLAESFIVSLDSGWNQIANPFAFPVAWRDVATQGTIQGPLFYDGASYDTASVLMPWEGYFVYNSSPRGAVLIIPPRAPTAPRQREAVSEEDYTLSLEAELQGTGIHDDHNTMGLSSLAREGEDAFDVRKPPAPSSPGVAVAIMENGKVYLRNFKPAGGGSGAYWEVSVTNAYPQLQVTLRISESGHLPEGFHLYVLDEDDQNALQFQGNSYTLRQRPSSVYRLKVIAGTREFALSAGNGIPLEPVEYALQQNYPNPFNPGTTIAYRLARRSTVTLDIYNILGQHIRSLVQEEQSTGSHVAVWDGADDRGIKVASGMYVYRLRAGDFASTKKMLVIR